jgi:hypothetical protein
MPTARKDTKTTRKVKTFTFETPRTALLKNTPIIGRGGLAIQTIHVHPPISRYG